MNLSAAGNELKQRHMERMTAALNWMSSRLPCSCPGNRDKDNGVIKTDSAVIKCHLLASGNSRSIRRVWAQWERNMNRVMDCVCLIRVVLQHWTLVAAAADHFNCFTLKHIYHARFRLLLWPQANGCSGDLWLKQNKIPWKHDERTVRKCEGWHYESCIVSLFLKALGGRHRHWLLRSGVNSEVC